MQKTYDSYKTTSLPWLREIPSHWKVSKIRRHFVIKKRIAGKEGFDVLSITQEGLKVKDLSTNEGQMAKEYSGYQFVYPGDYAMNSMDLICGYIDISTRTGVTSPDYRVFSLFDKKTCYPEYYLYLFRLCYKRRIFYPYGKGAAGKGRWRLNATSFKEFCIPVPSYEEQVQIVRYLDWQVSRIDKLIEGKKREIELLKERLLYTKNELVFRGISANNLLESSEIDWYGKVPIRWTFSKIRRHFLIQKRIAGQEGFDVLSITQGGLKVKDLSTNEGQMAQDYSGYQFVYPGDFAMNGMDLICGYIDISTQTGVTSPDYRVFSLVDTKTCYPQYYLEFFRLCYKRRIFYRYGRGAANQGRWRLNAASFNNFTIPVPPYEEQVKIAERIKQIEELQERTINGIERQIELLHEFKTKMIADVVTGRIDVRSVTINE